MGTASFNKGAEYRLKHIEKQGYPSAKKKHMTDIHRFSTHEFYSDLAQTAGNCVCVMVSKEYSQQSGLSPKNRKIFERSVYHLRTSHVANQWFCFHVVDAISPAISWNLSQIMANHLIFRYIWSTRPGKPTKSY